jgi:hypothetical protein
MITSACVFLAHGIVLLFDPELLLGLFHLTNSPGAPVSAQLFSAALIGLGLINWTARGLVLGGIYGRAIVYGNFAHALIGFLLSIRARLNGVSNDYFWIEVFLYLIFVFAFGVMLFRSPRQSPIR